MDGKVLESMIWTWCVIGPSLEFLGFAVGVSFYVAGHDYIVHNINFTNTRSTFTTLKMN